MKLATTMMAVALLGSASTLALAQSSSTPGSTSSTPANSAATNSTSATDSNQHTGIRQQLTSNLQQAGFTNIRVLPDSFLVQASDKSGNPVTMLIGPNSLEEVTTTGSASQPDNNGNNATNANSAQGGGMFTNIAQQDELTSKVVGLDVYNNSNQNIGTIKDVAYNGNHVAGYIVGVGGFLGMGDHYVAVRPGAVKLSYDSSANKWHASMNANADQLKAAPEYKYPSKG